MSITFTGILVYLGAFVFVILLILKQKEKINLGEGIPWHVSCFLIYIFAFTISKFVNSGLEGGFNTFSRTSQDYFIFLWIFFFVSKSNKNQKLVISAILAASLVSVAYGLLQFFHMDFFHRQSHVDRLSGFHKNPYSYGGQLIILFFFLLNYYKDKISKIYPLLILAACLFCILNTSERAVIFAVIAGTMFYFLVQKVKKEKLLLLAVLFSIPAFLTSFYNKKVLKRVKSVLLPSKHSSPNVRFKLWEIAFSIWRRNIIFGVGKFPTVYHDVGCSFPVQVLTHAHNVYLQVLVTHGLIGLLAYLNLFFMILKNLATSLKNNQYALCLMTVILALFIEGFFEYFWGDSEVRYLFLYFTGFVSGTISNNFENKEKTKEKV
ncbi:MAG: O-antigen ligase family protein [Candidatus Melainabacteria bacterium]|nr:O-antigen ligase family protein [Candidatus Melainabacteria bacterium]